MLPEIITVVPGPRSVQLAAALRCHESRNVTYTDPDFPVFWERAEGGNVWDADGNRYLDLTSGFGVATAGYGPEWQRRVYAEQPGLLAHAMGDVHPPVAKAALCRKLSEVTFERWGAGPGKVILGSAGFEAVEAALKTARLATGKSGVVAFAGGYHGLGYGAVTATGWEFFRSPLRGQLAEFATFVPFPGMREDPAAAALVVRRAVAETDAGAIVVEPVQGRGGVRIPPARFLAALRRVADETGALLIFDEIYTGLFRTGRWFACDHDHGGVPDIICLGKALTGSFPLSACVGRAEVMDAWPESRGEALHTSTFLGHPVGCAMALASLEYWSDAERESDVLRAESAWCHALAALMKCPGVKEVRGRGVLWGVEMEDAGRVQRVVKEGLKKGLILLGGGEDGRVLTLSPPAVLEKDEISRAGSMLAELVKEC